MFHPKQINVAPGWLFTISRIRSMIPTTVDKNIIEIALLLSAFLGAGQWRQQK